MKGVGDGRLRPDIEILSLGYILPDGQRECFHLSGGDAGMQSLLQAYRDGFLFQGVLRKNQDKDAEADEQVTKL